jgi:putative molybdopterin biosynthesis protein
VVTVINLAHRWQGFIVPKGNPRMITSWSHFLSGEHRIVNRKKGSGTRVLLDQQLQQMRISPSSIPGYEREAANHYATAAAVLKGEADAALGIESAARSMGLDFFPVKKERYDLIIPSKLLADERFSILLEVLNDAAFRQAVAARGGYDVEQMGREIARLS